MRGCMYGLCPEKDLYATRNDVADVCGGQVGVLNDVLTNVDNVVRKGRLGPGQTVCADLTNGVFKEHAQIAKDIGARAPYHEWLSSSTRLAELGGTSYTSETQMSSAEVTFPSSPLLGALSSTGCTCHTFDYKIHPSSSTSSPTAII